MRPGGLEFEVFEIILISIVVVFFLALGFCVFI